MKAQILLLTLACLFYCAPLFSQKPVKKSKRDTIAPVYPGGDQEWVAWLGKKIKSQVPVKKGAPAGKYTVIAVFTIGTDGKLEDIEIVQDPGYGTAEEVTRVLKNAPKWIPATLNGEPVPYRQRQPLIFQVAEEEVKKKKGE
jgi:hypothetical protein